MGFNSAFKVLSATPWCSVNETVLFFIFTLRPLYSYRNIFRRLFVGRCSRNSKTRLEAPAKKKTGSLAGNLTPIKLDYSPYILNIFNEHALKVFYLLMNISNIYFYITYIILCMRLGLTSHKLSTTSFFN